MSFFTFIQFLIIWQHLGGSPAPGESLLHYARTGDPTWCAAVAERMNQRVHARAGGVRAGAKQAKNLRHHLDLIKKRNIAGADNLVKQFTFQLEVLNENAPSGVYYYLFDLVRREGFRLACRTIGLTRLMLFLDRRLISS